MISQKSQQLISGPCTDKQFDDDMFKKCIGFVDDCTAAGYIETKMKNMNLF